MKHLFSDWFSTIYDRFFNIFNPTFQDPVFQYFLDSGFYIYNGLIFILVPILFMALFYYVWNNPYGKWWHWLIWLVITILVVFGWTFGYTNQFINDSNAQPMINCYNVNECSDYIESLPLEYANANAILGFFVGILGSLILKQWSKMHMHLPILKP